MVKDLDRAFLMIWRPVIRQQLSIGAALAFICLCGCSLIPMRAAGDLTFVSARAVRLNDLPDDVREDFQSSERPPRGVLEIQFSSRHNLAVAVQDWESPRVGIDECRRWPDQNAYLDVLPFYRHSNPYWHGKSLYRREVQSKSVPKAWQDESPHLYQIFIGTDRQGSDAHGNYDLSRVPLELCFQLYSISMTSAVQYTNAVAIPSRSISEAFLNESE
jgi:hypothetical protein